MIRVVAVLAFLSIAASSVAAPAQPFVQGSWPALLKAHQGKPLVVHFWGVTCAPCMLEMPQWAEIAHGDRAFDFVLVDADPVGADPSAEAPMLAKMGLADAEAWRFADDFAERLRYEVDPKWRGELPLTLLIGRDGGVKKIVGSADFAAVHAWLAEQESTKVQ
ncbi:MAG TPA: TlpA disulfide reductase family protein [Alphaproteobacteria bacterium]|jgi:thiol-disulfide isomerase/thioredoxin|nr:TlpA disulfide reductase family protein [Alphaproteobacteria bacterium]